MTKLISIVFSFVILLQSAGVCVIDLSQIDDFITHAQYHSEKYGDNVIVFISKHYGELKAEHDKEHQEEKEEHEQLPFQHHSNISTVAAFVLNSNRTLLKTITFQEIREHHFFYQEPTSSLHLEGLFQPPRQS